MCLIGYPDIAHFRAYSDKKFFNQEDSCKQSEAELAKNYQKDIDLADSLLDKLIRERLSKINQT